MVKRLSLDLAETFAERTGYKFGDQELLTAALTHSSYNASKAGVIELTRSMALLIRGRPWGLLFGLLAGSAIIFLGLMDTLYSIQQGIFSDFSAAAAEAFAICAACLILGPFTIGYLWRNRAHLLG